MTIYLIGIAACVGYLVREVESEPTYERKDIAAMAALSLAWPLSLTAVVVLYLLMYSIMVTDWIGESFAPSDPKPDTNPKINGVTNITIDSSGKVPIKDYFGDE